MVVAVISLIVAIGGTAAALPGSRTVGGNDLKNNAVGARSLGRSMLNFGQSLASNDPVAKDGEFTEIEGTVRCPAWAPFAFDPAVANMGPFAFERARTVVTSRFGGPVGYTFEVLTDQGPDVGYSMTVNCLPRR
jgi:hypothetical protein